MVEKKIGVLWVSPGAQGRMFENMAMLQKKEKSSPTLVPE